uniref:ribose-phosphate diphosphokinase n=1 Tax=Ignisphaera aggregans TaxID=334771 RepID=A0A7J3QGB2_9CREN
MLFLCLSGTPNSLVKGFEDKCRWKIVKPITRIFPDGEQYLRLPDLETQDVVVIQSLYPDQDRKIIELYLALEAINGSGAKTKFVILPYAAYSRQDKRFLKGEPISVRALYLNLKLLGVDTMVTVDIHSIQSLSSLGFKVFNIMPHTYMLNIINEKIDLVLAPDKGALPRAQEVAKNLGIPYDYIDKFRDRITGEIKIDQKELNVNGMTIAIVDDIISTGGTIAKAAQALYQSGAKSVIAVVTHSLISSKSIEVLSSANIDKLVTANTINVSIDLPKWIYVIDISKHICDEITKWVTY